MTETTSIYKDYIDITKTYQKQYGENTILLMQVGAFFEVYGFKCPATGIIQDSKIEEFTQMCNLNASEKKIVFESRQIIMAGFRDYSLDKYLQKIMDYGFTAVVYIQDKSGKNITRVLDAVHSPGTYISYDTECLPQMSNNIMCIWLERFTPLKIYNGTPFGRRNRDLRATLPINELKGKPPTEVCPILNLHRCKPRTKIGSKDILICGLSVANIFTGKSAITEFQNPYEMVPTTFDELERCVSIYSPSEVIIVSEFSEEDIESILQFSGLKNHMVHIVNSETSEKAKKCERQQYAQHLLDTFFGKESVQTYAEFSTYSIATQSFCYLLDFIQDHNPNLVKKIGVPDFHISNQMLLANHTLKQLNILSEGSKKPSLSSVSAFLNKSSSPMGRRLFHQQIVSPTTDIEWLNQEYEMTAKMLDQYDMIPQCRKILGKIRDLDKICRQIIVKKIYPSTIFQLYESINLSQQILTCFQDLPEIINYVTKDMKIPQIQDLLSFLDNQFYMDRCSSISSFSNIDDTFIKPGVSPVLDQLYQSYKENTSNFNKIHQYFNTLIQSESKNIDTTEYVKIHETEKSGSTLQITKKRGLILKSILAKRACISIPGTPIVIETKDVKLVSASGSTDEIEFMFLNNTCRDILYQKDGLTRALVSTYSDILARIESEWYQTIEQISQTIAKLDVLQCKAFIAREFNYCRPVIDMNAHKSFVKSEQLRHCLIEHIQQNEIYVPNDIHIGCDGQDGMLVYGTNAVGKTSLIRALGISVIMAQAGLYVPCSKFTYRPYTAIFSRILGNDNLFKGLSTFAVEMSELRIILKMADNNSLVLGDELCSGTETESALSIFVSGLEHLHRLETSFLFATHFHEIIGFDEIIRLDHLVLKHMSVIYDREMDSLIYDRRLCDGPGNRMYGLEVCKSLHLDESFLENAYRIREKYFSKSELSFDSSPYNKDKIRGICELCNEKLGEEIHHLNPQKSADVNGFIGTFHKDHPANLMTVCSKCHDDQHSKKKTIVRKKSTKGYVNLTLE